MIFSCCSGGRGAPAIDLKLESERVNNASKEGSTERPAPATGTAGPPPGSQVVLTQQNPAAAPPVGLPPQAVHLDRTTDSPKVFN